MSQTPVIITPGTGGASIAAELVSGTSFQQIQVYGGGGASVLAVNPDGSLRVSVIGTITTTATQGASVSGTVGASIIGLPPVNVTNVVTINSIYGNISGSVAATITNTNVNVSGSVVGFQGGSRTISGSVLAFMAPFASLVSGVTSIITTTSQTSVLATAPGAQRNYITNILVTNAGAVATQVNIMDGPNVMYAGFAAASGGGFSASFPTPLKQTNTVTSVDVKAVTTTSITAAISGFTAA